MSWIAEYDTQGRELPTCVHVTKNTGTMTHGATYVPIEDGKAVRAENARLRDELDFCLKHVPNCDGCEAMLDCWECLRADSSQKERKRLDYENEQLRELVWDIWAKRTPQIDFETYTAFRDRMHELGVEV